VGSWHTYQIDINGTSLNIWIDGQAIVTNFDATLLPASGHGMIGTLAYGDYTWYDNFQLYSSYVQCSASQPQVGQPLSVVECNSELPGSPLNQWSYVAIPNSNTGALLSLKSNPDLCVAAIPTADPEWPLQLARCNSSDTLQLWAWHFKGVSPDLEQASWLYLPGSIPRCLTVPDPSVVIGSPMTAAPCVPRLNSQSFWFDYTAGQVGSEATATCLGLC
jgi:hypothetical protein